MTSKGKGKEESFVLDNMLAELENMLETTTSRSGDLTDLGNITVQRITSDDFSSISEDVCSELFSMGEELVAFASDLYHLRTGDLEEMKNNLVQQVASKMEKPLQQKEEAIAKQYEEKYSKERDQFKAHIQQLQNQVLKLTKEKEDLNTALKDERAKLAKQKEEEALGALQSNTRASRVASSSSPPQPLTEKFDFSDIIQQFMEMHESLQCVNNMASCTELTLRVRDYMLILKTFKEKLGITMEESAHFIASNPQDPSTLPRFQRVALKDSFPNDETFDKFVKLQDTAKRVIYQALDEIRFLNYKLNQNFASLQVNQQTAQKEFSNLRKLFQTGTNSNIVVDPIESKKDQILRAGDKLRFLIQKSELEKVGVYATTLKNLKTDVEGWFQQNGLPVVQDFNFWKTPNNPLQSLKNVSTAILEKIMAQVSIIARDIPKNNSEKAMHFKQKLNQIHVILEGLLTR
jgi:hypothetical protein